MSDERPSVVCSGVLARACDWFRAAVNSSIVLRAACRSEHIAEMLWYVWQSAQAAEREACAQLCEQNLFYGLVPAEDGNAREYWNDAAQDCAGQIRKLANGLAQAPERTK